MTIFNQQGQHVQHQYNAGGDIQINSMQQEILKRIDELYMMVNQAAAHGTIDPPTAEKLQQELKSAATREKKSVAGHLKKAGELLKGITAAESIVSSIKALIKSIPGWFI